MRGMGRGQIKTGLAQGQVLRLHPSGVDCRVLHLLGEGGQGEVYRVDVNGQHFALKWYNDTVLRRDDRLRGRLQVAIDRGAPSGRFLWPFSLVTLPDGDRLGYLMPLRRAHLQDAYGLFGPGPKPPFRILATMCCLLANELFALHSKGLVYQDLNAGNLFFDPATGDIEICDNDNVDIDGAPSIMGGVWEFQAPEVILRRSGPSRVTDLHSLAVMLFRVLHLGHPLIGKRALEFRSLSEPAAMKALFATEARFVFDPADDRNRPLPEEHGPVLGHWAIYPEFVRQLFTRAFTEGLFDPVHGRVQESEWRAAMGQLRDSVIHCPACKAESFHDQKRLADKLATFPCWSCAAPLPAAPARMGIYPAGARRQHAPQHIVVLERGAQLFGHHTGSGGYDVAVAEISTPPCSIRNLSQQSWTAELGGATAAVAPGDRIELKPGHTIRFGRMVGEVKMSPPAAQ